MLSLYRRHVAKCSHSKAKKKRGTPADEKSSCTCPIWIQGTYAGKARRESLDVTSWAKAEKIKRQYEDGIQSQPKAVTITEAVGRLIADAEARKLNRSTLEKYKLLGTRLQDFCASNGIADLRHFGNEQALAFRASWTGSPRTLSKTLERFKSWCNFFVQNGWITVSPARGIKAPIVKPSPTLPFNDGEVSKLLSSADFRTRTFFKLLLHSGLRILDAAQLRPERIQDGKLFLYQAKTGQPVWVPLPPDLVADLQKLTLTGGFYFAVESDRPETVAEYYRVKLTKTAEAAGLIPKKQKGVERKNVFHPHRFRDTFAVRLLEKGVPLGTVSILLGHTSIKTTEESYAPWVASLQMNLEAAVQKTWQTKLVRVK